MVRHGFMFVYLLLCGITINAQDSPAYAEAKKLFSEKKYEQAIDKFKQAIDQLSGKKNYGEMKLAMAYLGHCYNYAGKEYFTRSSNQDSSAASHEIFVNIIAITEQTGDSAKLVIDKGTNAGIFEGAKGHVMLSYYSSRDKTPRNDFVATASVTLATNRLASVNAVFFDKLDPSKKKLATGDLVVLKVYPPKEKPTSVFYELASLGILFKDAAADTLMTQLALINNPSEEMGNRMMDYLLWDIHNFYDSYIADKTDATFTTIYKKGRFKGKTMKEAFRYAEKEDIYAFLEFVKTFPGKYIGKAWKLNETYATWVLNEMPPSEKGKYWLSRFIRETPLSKIDSFAGKFSWYIINDSLSSYRNMLNDIPDHREAISLCNKLYRISQILNDQQAQLEFVYYRSYLYQRLNDLQNGMKDALAAYRLKPSLPNVVSNLAYLYGREEKYDSCFLLLDPLMKANPQRYDIAGNLGWYKMLAGKFTEAETLCKIAHENDNSSYAYAVNYGHTFLLKGKADSARIYYTRSLESLYYPADFAEGPKKDFELFFTKGWRRKEAAEALDWMEEQYLSKYSYITRGNMVWDTASKLYSARKYRQAADKWKQYISVFDGMKEPGLSGIHNAYAWIGLCYEEAKDYRLAEQYYLKAVQMAKDTIVLADKLANDYSLLYNFYKKSGNSVKATGYKLLYDVEQQKLDDLRARPRLYIVAAEGKNLLQPESRDNAKTFYQNITTTVTTSFDSVVGFYMGGKNLSRQSLANTLDSIKREARPEDVLLFYYTGTVTEKDRERYYGLTEDTSLVTHIPEEELVNALKSIVSRKKLLISDVPSPGIMSKIAESYSAVSYALNEVIFICPGVLTPVDPATGTSAFTSELIGSAKELSAKEKFTAKELVGLTSARLGTMKYYVPVLSFAYAKDFTLFRNEKTRSEEEVLTRSTIEDETQSNKSVAGINSNTEGKNYALLIGTDEYTGFQKLNNAVYDVSELAKYLKNDFGFETELVINASKEEIEDKLIKYRGDGITYNPNDQLLIFIAGHGLVDKKENQGYLVTRDSKKDDPKKRTYLSYIDLFGRYLFNSRCNRIFLVLDACHAGKFFEQAMTRSDKQTELSREMTRRNAQGKRIYIGISSGADEPVSDGNPGEHSPFARSFMNLLVNQPFITAGVLVESLKANLPSTTIVRSGNFKPGDIGGQFIFELKNKPSVAPAIRTDTLK
ncbi:MAG: caspase family protein [Chitinophagaceae bacterium]|nr:caspase family protein [Chitinophagaceae bacterium]